MPKFQVLIDGSGNIIGTARTDVGSSGPAAPAMAKMAAGPGQRIAEVTVDDKTADLDPTALYAALKTKV